MSAPGGRRLVVGHLFADLLNLYGDRGNIATLVRRAEWRGIAVEVRTSDGQSALLLLLDPVGEPVGEPPRG